MTTFYYAIAGITLISVLIAFVNDEDAVLSPEAVLFILVATLLSPVTLPCIIFRQIRRFKERRQISRRLQSLQ